MVRSLFNPSSQRLVLVSSIPDKDNVKNSNFLKFSLLLVLFPIPFSCSPVPLSLPLTYRQMDHRNNLFVLCPFTDYKRKIIQLDDTKYYQLVSSLSQRYAKNSNLLKFSLFLLVLSFFPSPPVPLSLSLTTRPYGTQLGKKDSEQLLRHTFVGHMVCCWSLMLVVKKRSRV